MSGEFEGYQDGPAAVETADVHYESMAAQPSYDPEAGAYEAQPTEAYPVGEAVETPKTAAEQAEARIAGFIQKVGKMGIILGIFVCSVIYTIASGTACWQPSTSTGVVIGCTGIYGYAFSVGLLSWIVSLVYILLLRYTKALENNEMVHRIVGWFFVVWWVGGTGAGTFSAPFTASSNGYFAAWGAVFFSVVYLVLVSPIVKANMDRLKTMVTAAAFGDQIGLLVASVVELIDASTSCGSCVGYYAFAVSLGVISIVVTAISIFLTRSNNESPAYKSAFTAISIFLFFWWAIGFCVVTFHLPFVNTGNGYFASLFAVIFSTRLIRTTALWDQMVNRVKDAAGIPNQQGAPATATATATATYGEEQPQYAASAAYESSEGMDF